MNLVELVRRWPTKGIVDRVVVYLVRGIYRSVIGQAQIAVPQVPVRQRHAHHILVRRRPAQGLEGVLGLGQGKGDITRILNLLENEDINLGLKRGRHDLEGRGGEKGEDDHELTV